MTPQLFARLSSHPEKIVRKQLEGLVMMLAKRSPWSVVYPTLVDVNSYEEKPSEELQHILGSLVTCFLSLKLLLAIGRETASGLEKGFELISSIVLLAQVIHSLKPMELFSSGALYVLNL